MLDRCVQFSYYMGKLPTRVRYLLGKLAGFVVSVYSAVAHVCVGVNV